MRTGRKPKPTVLKLLTGNPGRRRLNLREPKPDALTVDVPPELTAADAVAEWQRAIVPAITRGQITTADRVLAIAHCELWATWRSQVADASRHAHVVAGKRGTPICNPARGMANRTLVILTRVDAELGLTPTSRSRVSTEGADAPQHAADKWAGLL